MVKKEQVRLIQDYINFMGKIYIILLSSLDKFSTAPLSLNEKVVLQILDREAISITEISLRTGLALSTLTNVIDKMEEKRLVLRRHSTTDRRKVKVELGDEGRRIKSRFNTLIRQLSEKFLGIISEEETGDFTRALESTLHTLSTEAEQIKDIFGSTIAPLKAMISRHLEKENPHTMVK